MERVGRSRGTIYRWVREGKIQTMQPMRAVYLNVEDLLRAEASMKPGRPRKTVDPKPTREERSTAPCSYLAAHRRVERAHGRARTHLCAFCGLPAHQWSYKGGSPDEIRGPKLPGGTDEIAWSPRVHDYQPLCVSCHRVFDGLQRLDRDTATKMLKALT